MAVGVIALLVWIERSMQIVLLFFTAQRACRVESGLRKKFRESLNWEFGWSNWGGAMIVYAYCMVDCWNDVMRRLD